MSKKAVKQKSSTKNQRLQSTKKLKEYTRTSSFKAPPSRLSKDKVHQIAMELAQLEYTKSSKHSQTAIIEGVSMWPLLRPGYLAKYKRGNLNQLNEGDIIVIRSRGRKSEKHIAIHRLLGRIGPYFLESGDNTYTAALIHEKDILGKVVEVFSHDGSKVKLPKFKPGKKSSFFTSCAHLFFYLHESKNQVLGSKKSKILWNASVLYRKSLSVLGLKVPNLPPL
ncbi:MAG: S26 family signal peptidase [Oligoflexia bacterium]|nr:S26 family signal peptidase [Oligoflexia bacterium]